MILHVEIQYDNLPPYGLWRNHKGFYLFDAHRTDLGDDMCLCAGLDAKKIQIYKLLNYVLQIFCVRL